MAIKSFSSGEVLTSADTNTYLTNSGLVYITSGALSGTATNFAGCFTSTFTNYRITCENINLSAAGYPSFRMLVGTTPNTTAAHYSALNGLDSNNNSLNMGTNSTVGVLGRLVAGTGVGSFSYDFFNPQAAVKTTCVGNFIGYYSGIGSASYSGGVLVDVATQFDGIQINTLGGQTYSSGQVTIYGYRKA